MKDGGAMMGVVQDPVGTWVVFETNDGSGVSTTKEENQEVEGICRKKDERWMIYYNDIIVEDHFRIIQSPWYDSRSDFMM